MAAYWAILGKDLRTELRTRQIVASTFVFAMLVLLVFNFSFELRGADLMALAPGVVWATFVFNGVTTLARSFAGERDDGAIEALLLAPVGRGSIFLAKWTLNLLLMLLVELATLVAFTAVFNVNALSPLVLVDSLFATAGFAAVGTSLSVAAFNSRARDVMLPVLLLPATTPILISAVRATSLVLSGAPIGAIFPWLNLLLAFDVTFVIVCYYSFGFLVED